MKVLLVHNFYQRSGGEETVFEEELKLIKKHGIEVINYHQNNSSIQGVSAKIGAFFRTIYSKKTVREIKAILREKKPDLVHVHNFFPLISPSVFYAAKSMNIKTVFTLHNYRIICPTATFLHNGKVVLNSIKSPWWAFFKKTYRNSAIGTLALCLMIDIHRRIGTWNTKVDRFIVLNEFSKDLFVKWGLSKKKIIVKPNFVSNAGRNENEANVEKEDHALFVGRISEEKGINVLLDAWKEINRKLVIVGDGPLKEKYVKEGNTNIVWKGHLPKEKILSEMAKAKFLILPSICFENCPMVILESFSVGTTALVSEIGGLPNIVKHGINGYNFKVGDAISLRDNVIRMFENPNKIKELSQNAHLDYLENYTDKQNLAALLSIYEGIINKGNG